MGRKIPAKKHRGVKDPVKQQEQRLKSLKDKINAAPRDPDEQPVPRSLLRLFGLPEPEPKHKRAPRDQQPPRRADTASGKSKHTQRGEQEQKVSKRNPVLGLRQLPGEDGRAFSLRINSALRSLHDAHDVTEYPTGLDEQEDVKGAAMAERRERRARKRARGGRGGHAAAGEGEDKPARAHALTLKKKAKKEKLQEEQSARRAELVYERVSFGEVAGAPPALPRPRRAPPAQGPSRPGQRSLLLHAVLAGTAPTAPGRPARVAPPPVERERRERARLEAVAAYRALKKCPVKPPVLI